MTQEKKTQVALFVSMACLACLVLMAFKQVGSDAGGVQYVSQPPSGGCSLSSAVRQVMGVGTTYTCQNGQWAQMFANGGNMPSGFTGIIFSGTCPDGWGEVTALSGSFIQATIAENNDVGQSSGSNSITPLFTGTSSQSTSSVSAGTPAGTATFTGTPINFGTAVNVSLLGLGQALTGPSTITPAGSVGFSGSALGTHAHTITAAGTIAAIDPRPVNIKGIFCSKN